MQWLLKPKTRNLKTIILLLLLFTSQICYAKPTKKTYDFTDAQQTSALVTTQTDSRFPPKIDEDAIHLMDGIHLGNLNNAIFFPEKLDDSTEIEQYTFELYITTGAYGAGFALIDQSLFTEDTLSVKISRWDTPNIDKSFALGIDIYNPQTSAFFDEFGNFYGRAEREISLHWDGKEMFKALSPIEFRSEALSEPESHTFTVTLHYITAGALASVNIDDTPIIEKYFIPEMAQYTKKPTFGATTGDLTTNVYVVGFSYETSGIAPKYQKIYTRYLLENEAFTAERRDMTSEMSFPKVTGRADKAILTIDLGGLAGGVSGWDVSAAIYLIDEDGQRYEIVRYITPYHRGYVWKVDVSDFLPIFMGNKKIYARVDTWEPVTEDPAQQKGWLVNAHVDFYSGNVDKRAFLVKNLYSGSFEYGNPARPMSEDLPPLSVDIPSGAKGAKLRFVVTGHGMSPNSENAAEFRPSPRTVIVNGTSYKNTLWKTDNYLNPCRPQGGTWKFDRAGWAPGDVVSAWEIDVTNHLKGNKTLNISYIPDDYINENRGQTWEPFHRFESQVVFY